MPNSGKSTLFNALTGGYSPVAPFPFSTAKTHVGEAKVADPRLDELAAFSASAKTVPAVAQFVDIRGLASRASCDDEQEAAWGSSGGNAAASRGALTRRVTEDGGELSGSFLGAVRETDALLLVLRAFDDASVEGVSDPVEALGILEYELCLADAESLQRQVSRRKRQAKDKALLPVEVETMEKALAQLNSATPIWRSGLAASEREQLAGCFLLTSKPSLVVLNTDTDASTLAKQSNGTLPELRTLRALSISARLESELMELPEHERSPFARELGLGEGAAKRLIGAAYDLLGLRTFFTTGPKETRAWPFSAGMTAAECAGLIHTDMQRGFIRADCVDWQTLLAEGSETAARRNGKIRSEGRGYLVQDGDVLEIRFKI